MNFKNNINPQDRGFEFAAAGKNEESGRSAETAKKNIQNAIDATQSLDPVPGPLATALVRASQGGSFSESFELFDFVQFDGTDVSINVESLVVVEMASFVDCRLATVVNTQDNGIIFNIDGQQSVGIDISFTGVFGQNGVAFNIVGACDNLFLVNNQMALRNIGAIGFNITASSPTPIHIEMDQVSLEANDTTFMIYDPPNLTDEIVINAASINPNGFSNTKGYVVKNGLLIIVQQGILRCDEVMRVEAGAIVVLSCENVVGNIIVEAGGILVCNVARFVGSVTDEGTLSGILGNTILDPVIFNAINNPDTDALLTHMMGGTFGGTSRDFFSTRKPGGVLDGNPGDIATRNNGEDSAIYQHQGAAPSDDDWKDITRSKRQAVLVASDFTTQNPIGKDAPMQIKFGAAQFGASDPIELAADGTIKANISDQYYFDISVQFGRTGAGQSSLLFFRLLKNGSQEGNSLFSEIDNENTNQGAQFNVRLDLDPTDLVTFELIRDNIGFDSGGLFSNTPSLAGVNPSASASINVSRRVLLDG